MNRLEPHSIVKLVNDQLVRGADEPYAIDAATAARVRDELCAITSGPALTRAARDLIYYAYHLAEQQGAPKAGRAVLEIAKSALPLLARLGGAGVELADELRDAAKKLRRLAGERSGPALAPPGAGASCGIGKRRTNPTPRGTR